MLNSQFGTQGYFPVPETVPSDYMPSSNSFQAIFLNPSKQTEKKQKPSTDFFSGRYYHLIIIEEKIKIFFEEGFVSDVSPGDTKKRVQYIQ